MKFGILKSKIETKLVESYSKNTFRSEMQNFKKFVLSNKELSKLYHLYENLSAQQGFDKEFAQEFVDECVATIKNLNIQESEIQKVSCWLKDVATENKYQDIDNLISESVLNIPQRILSKRKIVESLTKKQVVKEHVNIPLNSMVKVANQTLEKHINSLNESEQKIVKELLKLDNKAFEKAFNELKENTKEKLNTLLESEKDFEAQTKIKETISRIENENPDRIEYVRIKNLMESI